MQKCQRCDSNRMISVSGKCVDQCSVYVDHLKIDVTGYVPNFLGPDGYGDYLEVDICADCGRVQDQRGALVFPISDKTLTEGVYGM